MILHYYEIGHCTTLWLISLEKTATPTEFWKLSGSAFRTRFAPRVQLLSLHGHCITQPGHPSGVGKSVPAEAGGKQAYHALH